MDDLLPNQALHSEPHGYTHKCKPIPGKDLNTKLWVSMGSYRTALAGSGKNKEGTHSCHEPSNCNVCVIILWGLYALGGPYNTVVWCYIPSQYRNDPRGRRLAKDWKSVDESDDWKGFRSIANTTGNVRNQMQSKPYTGGNIQFTGPVNYRKILRPIYHGGKLWEYFEFSRQSPDISQIFRLRKFQSNVIAKHPEKGIIQGNPSHLTFRIPFVVLLGFQL
ncbi:hypothetical protein FB451DRAFT_1161998 [Mycena latifolia]|nr:hypothetical protein FB451DRAFT_1161998 [Mycena latifolia]